MVTIFSFIKRFKFLEINLRFLRWKILPKDCQKIAKIKNVHFLKKNLSSHIENYFFCHHTLIFNYRKEDSFSHKISGFYKNGQKKCPKSENQNTFHFQKTMYFPSYVGKKKWPKIRKSWKSPTICSIAPLNILFKYIIKILKETTACVHKIRQ